MAKEAKSGKWDPTKARTRYQWSPGQSGNPSGRPKAPKGLKRIREECRKGGLLAVRSLLYMATGDARRLCGCSDLTRAEEVRKGREHECPPIPPRERRMACNDLLVWGYGKPEWYLEEDTDEPVNLDAEQEADMYRAALRVLEGGKSKS